LYSGDNTRDPWSLVHGIGSSNPTDAPWVLGAVKGHEFFIRPSIAVIPSLFDLCVRRHAELGLTMQELGSTMQELGSTMQELGSTMQEGETKEKEKKILGAPFHYPFWEGATKLERLMLAEICGNLRHLLKRGPTSLRVVTEFSRNWGKEPQTGKKYTVLLEGALAEIVDEGGPKNRLQWSICKYVRAGLYA